MLFAGLAALAKNPKFQSILQRKMREEMNFTDPYDRCVYYMEGLEGLVIMQFTLDN